jgi:hypothetical protein
MTVQALPWCVQGQSHEAEIARVALAAAFGVPVAAHTVGSSITTAGGGHGVVGSGDLAVTENGTPNMSVNVAAGAAVIRAGYAGNITGGVYTALNDATANVVISAADPTNPRYDLVLMQARDDSDGGDAAADARLVVVTGTPAASPSDPSLTSYPNSLVLARVQVDAAAASITTAKITDLRTRAHALGGVGVGSSSQRPTGASLSEGKVGIDTTNDRLLIVDGSNVERRVGHYSSTGRTGCRLRRTTNQSIPNITVTAVSWTTEDFDPDGMIAVTGSTVTCKVAGLHLITFAGTISGGATFNEAQLRITSAITGVPTAIKSGGPSGSDGCSITACVPLAVNDTFDIAIYHSSGAAKDLNPAWLHVVYLGP